MCELVAHMDVWLMTRDEFEKSVTPEHTWDEVMSMLGAAWKLARKQYDKDYERLGYAWADLMTTVKKWENSQKEIR